MKGHLLLRDFECLQTEVEPKTPTCYIKLHHPTDVLKYGQKLVGAARSLVKNDWTLEGCSHLPPTLTK